MSLRDLSPSAVAAILLLALTGAEQLGRWLYRLWRGWRDKPPF